MRALAPNLPSLAFFGLLALEAPFWAGATIIFALALWALRWARDDVLLAAINVNFVGMIAVLAGLTLLGAPDWAAALRDHAALSVMFCVTLGALCSPRQGRIWITTTAAFGALWVAAVPPEGLGRIGLPLFAVFALRAALARWGQGRVALGVLAAILPHPARG